MTRKAPVLGLLLLVSCGSERSFSGAWKQVGTCAGEGCQAGFAFELHLGRYGDKVSGLLVRFVEEPPPFETFDPQNECGCFVLQSGGASEDGVGFQVPMCKAGCRDREEPFVGASCLETLGRPPCAELLFDLTGDDDLLEGKVWCAGAAPPTQDNVRFEPVSGRPRRTCLDQCANAPSAVCGE